MPIKFITYGMYVWAPVACVVCWLGMLLGLLLWWLITDDGVMYTTEDATIVFISDVGAAHQWLFILGCVLTAVFYVLSLLLERWLRHVDRIPGTVRSRERTLDILAIVFGTIGAIALILLSCFNDVRFPTVHWICTIVFVVFVAISCVFQTWEFFALKEDHPDRNHLRRNAIIKIIVVTIAIAVAIGFGICYAICSGNGGPTVSARCNRVTSAGAVLEWVISFLLAIYFATFVLDLWPAAKTSPRAMRRSERKNGSIEKGEKGLVAPAAPFAAPQDSTVSSVAELDRPTEAERSDYYSSNPDYYQQNPEPVHNASGIAYQNPQYAAPSNAYGSAEYAAPSNAYGTPEYAAPASAYPSAQPQYAAPATEYNMPNAEAVAPTYHGRLASEPRY